MWLYRSEFTAFVPQIDVPAHSYFQLCSIASTLPSIHLRWYLFRRTQVHSTRHGDEWNFFPPLHERNKAWTCGQERSSSYAGIRSRPDHLTVDEPEDMVWKRMENERAIYCRLRTGTDMFARISLQRKFSKVRKHAFKQNSYRPVIVFNNCFSVFSKIEFTKYTMKKKNSILHCDATVLSIVWRWIGI